MLLTDNRRTQAEAELAPRIQRQTDFSEAEAHGGAEQMMATQELETAQLLRKTN